MVANVKRATNGKIKMLQRVAAHAATRAIVIFTVKYFPSVYLLPTCHCLCRRDVLKQRAASKAAAKKIRRS